MPAAMSALVLDAPSPTLPRQWAQQAQLLERQHDRLEALLTGLIERHAVPDEGRSPQQLDADRQDCGRLLRQLGFHLRLEERWLSRLHSFCGGHRSSHRQALTLAADGWAVGQTLRGARLPWLMDLQEWFHQHRHGVDAIAYRRAEARARGQS
jgi:hypothetical protein